MTDSDLRALRALDPARPADVAASGRPDAQAMLARVLAAPVGVADARADTVAAPRAERSRPRAWRLATLVGVAAALAVTGVVLPNLGERSADAWTATPQSVSDERALAAVQECVALWPDVAGEPATPVLAERRGRSELVVVAGDGWDAQCLLVDGGAASAFDPRAADGPVNPPPGADEARMDSAMTMQVDDGEGYVVALFGELGEDVMAVTLRPRDTEPVHATVVNGYFAGFWPASTPRSQHTNDLAATLVLRSGEVRDVVLNID